MNTDRWPLIYIAGPYTAPDPVLNVRRAVAIAEAVEVEGCAVFIPHLSMLWHLVSPADIDDWYERDFLVLEHCDALIRFDGASTGADREVAHAAEFGIPTFLADRDNVSVEFHEWRKTFATTDAAVVA